MRQNWTSLLLAILALGFSAESSAKRVVGCEEQGLAQSPSQSLYRPEDFRQERLVAEASGQESRYPAAAAQATNAAIHQFLEQHWARAVMDFLAEQRWHLAIAQGSAQKAAAINAFGSYRWLDESAPRREGGVLLSAGYSELLSFYPSELKAKPKDLAPFQRHLFQNFIAPFLDQTRRIDPNKAILVSLCENEDFSRKIWFRNEGLGPEDRIYLLSEGQVVLSEKTTFRVSPIYLVQRGPLAHYKIQILVEHPHASLARKIFQDVLRGSDLLLARPDPEDFYRLVYNFFNAMPFHRGSALIGTLFFRALYSAAFHEVWHGPENTDGWALIRGNATALETLAVNLHQR